MTNLQNLPRTTRDSNILPKPGKNPGPLDLIDINRAKGMELFSKGLQRFTSDPENQQEHLGTALEGVKTHLEANTNLADILRHDLLTMIPEIVKHTNALLEITANLRALAKTLIDKDVISDLDVAEAWKEIVETERARQVEQPVTESL